MIYQLTREEQDRLHHRYRGSDLFCHWSPLLAQLMMEQNELDVSTLWYQREKVLDELRGIEKDRDEMIPYLFNRLREDFRLVKREGNTDIIRTEILAEYSAVTVMCLVMTELLNAVVPGHEDEDFGNSPICVAIANLLRNHPHFQKMMDRFFKKKKDNSGKKIVIKPSDPMDISAMLADMDDVAAKEIETMVQKLQQLTQGLKQTFGDKWDVWGSFCREVCMSQEFLSQLNKVVPNANEWGINQKMVCNMIGLFNSELKLNHPVSSLNRLLSTKQLRSYISNHADFSGSDSVLSKAQHEAMKKILIKVA